MIKDRSDMLKPAHTKAKLFFLLYFLYFVYYNHSNE